MTRKSKREIARDVEDLEADDGMVLDGGDMWDWIHDLRDRGPDVDRPPEYFPDGTEWSAEMGEMQATAADRFPELQHLTPPEAFVLSYKGEDLKESLVKLLATSDTPGAREWRDAVSDLTDGED